MGTPIGNLGGIAISLEDVYGETDDPVTWIWQHPVPSSLGFRRETVEPNLLSYAAQSARGYSGSYVDGDLVVGFDVDKKITGLFFGSCGPYAGGKYTIGSGLPAEARSLSVLMNYAGGGATATAHHEWVHAGVKANSLRIDFLPDSNSTLTLTGIGQSTLKSPTSLAPVPPPEANVFMPSDFASMTIGGQAVCLLNGSVEMNVPKSGFEKRCLGGLMQEPITKGRPSVTASLNCRLTDGASDTIGILADFLAGTNLGDVVISDGTGALVTVKNLLMEGDWPGLQEGEMDFTIQGSGEYVEVAIVDSA
jgi:hypothetical protein